MNNCLERKAIEAIVMVQSEEDESVIHSQSFVVVAMTLMTVAVGKAEMMMMMTVTAVIKYRWQINLSISNRSQSFKSV